MFYNRGEVLSDQFDYFKLILFWVPECSFCKDIKQNRIKLNPENRNVTSFLFV